MNDVRLIDHGYGVLFLACTPVAYQQLAGIRNPVQNEAVQEMVNSLLEVGLKVGWDE